MSEASTEPGTDVDIPDAAGTDVDTDVVDGEVEDDDGPGTDLEPALPELEGEAWEPDEPPARWVPPTEHGQRPGGGPTGSGGGGGGAGSGRQKRRWRKPKGEGGSGGGGWHFHLPFSNVKIGGGSKTTNVHGVHVAPRARGGGSRTANRSGRR